MAKKRYTLENQYLKIQICSLGAEIISIFNKIKNIEYLWEKDPAIWDASFPILFPIVGLLQKGVYLLDGKTYKMPLHGFAHQSIFEIKNHTLENISLSLTDNESTRSIYPFPFELSIQYYLIDKKLYLYYTINNIGDTCLLYMFGLHPGFSIPTSKFSLSFIPCEIWKTVLIHDSPYPHYEEKNFSNSQLDLSVIANRDRALIFSPNSKTIHIKDNNINHISFSWDQKFKYLALWHKSYAPYLCIEPWTGHSDIKNTSPQELSKKTGVCSLIPKKSHYYKCILEFY